MSCHGKKQTKKKDKQTQVRVRYLQWEFTVSCLFAIYNLWPLQLDCVCVLGAYVGGWGVLALGSAIK